MLNERLSMGASRSDQARVETELRLTFQEGRVHIDGLGHLLGLVDQSQTYSNLSQYVGEIPDPSVLIRQMSSSTQPGVLPQRSFGNPQSFEHGSKRGHPFWYVAGIMFVVIMVFAVAFEQSVGRIASLLLLAVAGPFYIEGC